MLMRLLLVAGTHVPRRARDLPAQLWAAVEAADVVIHAGDWVDEPFLDRFQARCARLVGVYGNNDGPALRLLNPGSPTDRRRQPHATYMTAVVRDGALVEVTLHRVTAPRG
jgi:predicted phosphodiesterase